MGLSYPSSLPCPQTLSIAAAERRQSSDSERPRQSRALQRDRLAIEQVTLPPLNAQQAAVFRAWWSGDLIFGASWFAATWPSPRGRVELVRRWVGAPRWQFVAGGFWRISGQCEVRGQGLLNTERVLVSEIAIAGNSADIDPAGKYLLSGGFTAADTVVLRKIIGTYSGWSGYPTDDDPGIPVGGAWTNRFQVSPGGVGIGTTYLTPDYPSLAAVAPEAVGQAIQLTGASSYAIWLFDDNPGDNRGGLSLRATLL